MAEGSEVTSLEFVLWALVAWPLGGGIGCAIGALIQKAFER